MTIKYALIVAVVLAALACGQAPATSPTQDVRTPTPAPLPTSPSHCPQSHSHPANRPQGGRVGLGILAHRPVRGPVGGDRTGRRGLPGQTFGPGRYGNSPTTGTGRDQPVISGDTVAWTDQSREIETHDNNSRAARSLADDIFVLDLNSGETRRITEVPAKRSGLKISGKRLVWLDNRNELGEHYAHYDIYAYDLETNEEIAVAVAAWCTALGRDRRGQGRLGGQSEQRDSGNGPIRLLRMSGQSLRHLPVRLHDRGRTRTGRVWAPTIRCRTSTATGSSGGTSTTRAARPSGSYDIDTGEKRALTSPSLSGVDRPLVSGRLRGVDCGLAVRRV